MTDDRTPDPRPGRDAADVWTRGDLTVVFPWIEHLDDGEFDEFTGDLYGWRATAEIHADPELEERMRVASAEARAATITDRIPLGALDAEPRPAPQPAAAPGSRHDDNRCEDPGMT